MKILVAHDGSEQSAKALRAATDMAAKFGGSLTIVAAIPDLCLMTEEIGQQACDAATLSMQRDAEAAIRKAAARLADEGLTARTVIAQGRPVDVILATAREIGADLIIVGSHGRHGAAKLLLGSVSSKVAERAEANVLIVK